MSMRRRVKALETAMVPPEPGGRVWLDHEPTLEILGAGWCEGQQSKHLDRLPGESIQDLKLRCLHEARRYPDGVVFIIHYDYGMTVPTRCEGMYQNRWTTAIFTRISF